MAYGVLIPLITCASSPAQTDATRKKPVGKIMLATQVNPILTFGSLAVVPA